MYTYPWFPLAAESPSRNSELCSSGNKSIGPSATYSFVSEHRTERYNSLSGCTEGRFCIDRKLRDDYWVGLIGGAGFRLSGASITSQTVIYQAPQHGKQNARRGNWICIELWSFLCFGATVSFVPADRHGPCLHRRLHAMIARIILAQPEVIGHSGLPRNRS